MGSVKALLPVQGRPAVHHLATRFLTVCQQCVVVTGHHSDEVEAAVSGVSGVRVARNPRPQRGQLSSLQSGIGALRPGEPEWFLFAPVDCMGIDDELLRLMRDAMSVAPAETLLLIPQFRERRGHPVAARIELASRFLALKASESARTLTHLLRDQTRFVPAANERFLLDIDQPEDYSRFLATRAEDS